METNEIMTTNEEVIDVVAEEIANADSGKAMKAVAGVGLTVLAGAMIYKFVVKPLVAKAKAKKEEATMFEVIDEDLVDHDDEVENDD